MPSLPTHPSKKDFPGSLLPMLNKDHEKQEECKKIFDILISDATKRGHEKSIKWGEKKKWLVTNEDSIFHTEFTATGRFPGYNQPPITANDASNRVNTAFSGIEKEFRKILKHGHSPDDADFGEKIPEHYRESYEAWYNLNKAAEDDKAPNQAAKQREVQNAHIGEVQPMGANSNAHPRSSRTAENLKNGLEVAALSKERKANDPNLGAIILKPDEDDEKKAVGKSKQRVAKDTIKNTANISNNLFSMVSVHSEVQAKAAQELTQVKKSELNFRREVWMTSQKANANKSKLKRWEIGADLHQKSKKYKLEKNLRLMKILKEEKKDAKEELKEAKEEEDEEEQAEAEANLKQIKQQIKDLRNRMMDDDDEEPDAPELFDIVKAVSDDSSGEKTGKKDKKMPAEVVSIKTDTNIIDID
ncbi:predicted protein [Chaetoceros tenuissimus]|nr:predicted protein [Chaetoceros tenuissimus]